MKYLLLMLISWNVNASESWLCVEASSERSGNIVKACGVGSGGSEDQARAAAFTSAQSEFEHICKLSDDCANHETSVKPGRTTCDVEADGFKCVRMLTFTIGNKRESVDIQALQGGSVNRIKIKKGMPKREVIAMMGAPIQVQHAGDRTLFNFKNAKVCSGLFDLCGVWIQDGKVWAYQDFFSVNTDELD